MIYTDCTHRPLSSYILCTVLPHIRRRWKGDNDVHWHENLRTYYSQILILESSNGPDDSGGEYDEDGRYHG